MNKNILFVGLAVVVLLVALTISNSSNKNEEVNLSSDNQKTSMDKMEGENMAKDDSMMENDSMDKMEDDSMMDKDEAIKETEDGFGRDLAVKDDSMMMTSGEYVDYDSSLLSRAEHGNVVLFFHAKWCPTCKVLDTSLNQKLADFPKDLTILKVDYDTASELKKKYAITYQHTLVQVDAQGNVINKWNGGSDLNSILEKLK